MLILSISSETASYTPGKELTGPPIGEYIGGIDREHYYWGYQSDGNRLLCRAATSLSNDERPYRKRRSKDGIKFIRQGRNVWLATPRDQSAKEIALFTCDGSLVRRSSFIDTKTTAFELGNLPKGVYVAFVQTEKEKQRQLLHIY